MDVAPCRDPARRRHPGARQTHCDQPSADHWLSRERHFVNYHRVLNRAGWNSRRAAHLLLGLLIDTFVPASPVILGLDDTIERRRGKRIAAKGIYRDPVRSSDAHFVKASGLRWTCFAEDTAGEWAGALEA
ncbi:transposase (plasmid) [Microvirga sp. RSM25]|uniref:transposase n=1 Tax=Microvirga sp. RSM25 TaxID=3273802 RepID=UPI00384C6E7A